MKPIAKETWEKLSQPINEQLVARLALPDITSGLYCAMDANNQRHLLLPLEPSAEQYMDKQSRGVSVITRELTIQGDYPKRYLDLACLDFTGYAIFDLIGGEVANELAGGSAKPAEIVKKILSKWRRFWGQLPSSILSIEEQIGLFAELWFLLEWLFPKFGQSVVLNWRGPWGSRHDFEWPDKSIEVKATTNSRGRIHHIHGLRQLENPENGPLFLFSMVLREENGSLNDLPSLIEKCRYQLINSEDGLSHFENALAHIGYSPLFEEEYKKVKLHIIECLLFEVCEDFPRLTTHSFSQNISTGIERVDYEINLNSFNHLIAANQPNDLTFM